MRLLVRRLVGFDWDEANWRKSELKHGVAAAEVEEALLRDPLVQVDPLHSADEQRYVALGWSIDGRRLFIAFTIRRNRIRPISARPMSRKERKAYDEQKA